MLKEYRFEISTICLCLFIILIIAQGRCESMYVNVTEKKKTMYCKKLYSISRDTVTSYRVLDSLR